MLFQLEPLVIVMTELCVRYTAVTPETGGRDAAYFGSGVGGDQPQPSPGGGGRRIHSICVTPHLLLPPKPPHFLRVKAFFFFHTHTRARARRRRL